MRETTQSEAAPWYPAILTERGNGFAGPGDVVYCGDDEQLYRIVSTSGTIHTDDRLGRPNYLHCRVQYVGATADLTDDEWDALPTVGCRLET